MPTLFENLSSKLLDLGLRNKSINFKDNKLRSIEIIDPDASTLFEEIITGNEIKLVPSIKEEKEAQQNEEGQTESEVEEYVPEEFQEIDENEAIAYKRGEKLERIVKAIKRFNDQSVMEKGVGILHLAFGFIKWREANFSKIDVKSPLLFVKVQILYDKGDRSFSLVCNDNEVIVNQSLKAKFEKDFGLVLPDYDQETDNYETYIEKVNQIAIDNDWQIIDQVYLGIFSFAKQTMYEDLKANNDEMETQDLVRAIFNSDKEADIKPLESDSYYDEDYFKSGQELVLHNVVDADSSQIRAIEEAKRGKSFVIQGPPGTGKSQTITNIIAELISDGKKVLFVSEKLAALNVVFNNLKKVGLEGHCLQVHSDKANKKEFVLDIYNSLFRAKRGAKNRQITLSELEKSKRELDLYASVLYKKYPVIGRTPYEIISGYSKYASAPDLDYTIDNIKNLNIEYLVQNQNILEKYSEYKGNISKKYWESVWFGFKGDIYTYDNGKEIKNNLASAHDYMSKVNGATKQISSLFDVNFITLDDIKSFAEQFDILSQIPLFDPNILDTNKLTNIINAIDEYVSSKTNVESYKKESLSKFDKGIYDLEIFNLYKKFHSEYQSPFRIFNKKYKNDFKLYCSFAKPDAGKLKFQDVKDSITSAYRYLSAKKVLDEATENFNKLSSYDYVSKSIEELKKIEENLETFGKVLKSDLHLISNISSNDMELLKEKCLILTNLIKDEDLLSKLQFVQSYFEEDFVNFKLTPKELIESKLKGILDCYDGIGDWARFYGMYQLVSEARLVNFIKACIDADIDLGQLKNVYSKIFYHQWLMYVLYSEPTLKSFKRSVQNLNVNTFRRLDQKLFEVNRMEIIENTYEKIQREKYNVANRRYNYALTRQLSILEHEANKQRAIKPIRYLFKNIPDVIYLAKPCLLMSPLSVATYLKYEKGAFDTVIFDEASQIFPWDAIGSIARAKQVIIVGDSMQMPPTYFFQSGGGEDDGEDYDDENAVDFESILDLATATLPQTSLNWHYRSRTESLIAFSNHNYYHDRLITFPASRADTDDLGIKFDYVRDGVFKDRSNIKEAEEVVKQVFEHFKRHPERSLGVVCFSINQQMLLEDIFENEKMKHPSFAKFFDENLKEPFFIKNLETVQGDERDTIIFSIGYGKDTSGDLKHNFGPLNRKGGERRLNVAVTRAKFNVLVVSSIHAGDIDLRRTNARGAKLLRDYLDLAERGIEAYKQDIVVDPNAKAESYFEEEVANFIRESGYQVELQVGCSGYRIDICVRNPSNSDFVLAVECDGATYHSAKNTRDRDRLRQQVLERLDWKFYRIWSTDWFFNQKIEKEQLLAAISKAILEYDLKKKSDEEARVKVEKERFEDVQKEEKKVKEKQSHELSFIDDIDEKSREFLNKFDEQLKTLDIKFEITNKELLYGYRSKIDIGKRTVFYWFWFCYKNDELVFKYRNSPENNDIAFSVNAAESGVNKLISIVQKLINDRGFGFTEDEESRSDDEYAIYDIIRKRFNYRKATGSRAQAQIANEIYDDVMSEISLYAIEHKFFKSKDEFDQFKYSRRLSYLYHGVSFSLRNITNYTAKQFFVVYKAKMVIEVIKEYEKIFRSQIVVDYETLLSSLIKIISSGSSSFSSCQGLNSNFRVVPDSALLGKVEEIDEISK